jgi:hypothetical protein
MSQIIQSTKLINGIDLKTPPLPTPVRATTTSSPEKITVACVWWGTLYGKEYVEKLRNSVKRHLTTPHDFVCLTDRDDVPEGVIKVPLEVGPEGWWQKTYLFKPGLFKGKVLFLDLDVIIINSLDKFATIKNPFTMIENFGPNKKHAAHNSSVMVWTPSKQTEKIYTQFSKEVTKELHGDQCWIWRVMDKDITNYVHDWVDSYKYGKLPQWARRTKNTSIIVFHGQPKPHDNIDINLKQHWI